MRVEVVEPQDWRGWRNLRLEALQDTPIGFGRSYEEEAAYDDEYWEQRLAAEDRLAIIAYEDDSPVGMAAGVRDEKGRPQVVGVYVRPEARGGTVLAVLIEALAAWAAPDPLWLAVHEDNHRARRAYEKLGFALTGETTPGGGIDGRDLQQMRR